MEGLDKYLTNEPNTNEEWNGLYNIIYADPAWKFGSRLANGNDKNGIVNLKQVKIGDNYSVMTTKEICDLKVSEISDKDCALFMWTTDAHLEEAMKVINAWGFKYKTIGFTWLKKEKSGVQSCYVGFWTTKCAEICLLATKGNMSKYLKKRNVRQLVEATRGRHSEKPQEVRNRIVEMFGDIPRIELFARQKVEGWDAWGNEVESDCVLS
jgi:N6-adenosine-specific RNA methylase IME4